VDIYIEINMGRVLALEILRRSDAGAYNLPLIPIKLLAVTKGIGRRDSGGSVL